MTEISLNQPEDLSNPLTDLAKTRDQTRDQTTTYLATGVLRDYTEHEETLTAQIELAVKEADQGKLAPERQVATIRAKRWCQNAG